MPKAQTVTVKARGLYDAWSDPWALPDGALSEAMNVEIGPDGSIIPRPGFNTTALATTATGLASFNGTSLVLFGATSSDNAYRYNISGVSASYGVPVVGPGGHGYEVQTAMAAQSMFMTAQTGTYVLDSYTGTPRAAGVTTGLDVSAAVAGAGTAVPNNVQVAYRIVFGRKDANGRILLGAPSTRTVLTNTAGSTQNVTLVTTIPADVADGNHFVQVYRTSSSVDQNTDPGDECYLVYEAAVAAGGALTTATITDSTPDGLGGASLYTNPSQESILAGNERPPLAYDLAEFGGSLWYADVTFPARQLMYLLGTTGTNGLALNDTITINSQVFTAKAAETIASKEFQLYTAGTADANIRNTVASLIRVVNRTSAAGVYAKDLSEPAPGGIPGVFSLQRTDRTSTLTITVSRSTAWSPAAGATVAPVRCRNGLVFSKDGQPDAVPTSLATAPLLVGSADVSISRIIPTRNSLWVLKADGVYRITGSGGQFELQPFDPTTPIVATRSAVSLDNCAWFLSDQGVVRVSESGVEVMSGPLSRTFRQYSGGWTSADTVTTAVAREAVGKYLIRVHPVYGSDHVMSFDIASKAWTEWNVSEVGFTSGAVMADNDALYLLTGSALLAQRQESNLQSPIYSGNPVSSYRTFTGAVSLGGGEYSVTVDTLPPLSDGDLFWQLGGAFGYGVRTMTSPNRIVLRNIGGNWSADPGFITSYGFPAFTSSVTFHVKAPTPGTSVEWQEGALLFSNVEGESATITLTGSAGSDASITVDKLSNAGSAKQIRFWPGRVSAFSPSMAIRYVSKVAAVNRPTELAGIVWTFSPQGDGVSR